MALGHLDELQKAEKYPIRCNNFRVSLHVQAKYDRSTARGFTNINRNMSMPDQKCSIYTLKLNRSKWTFCTKKIRKQHKVGVVFAQGGPFLPRWANGVVWCVSYRHQSQSNLYYISTTSHERHVVSNHRYFDYLFISLCIPARNIKVRVLRATGYFPAQRATISKQ